MSLQVWLPFNGNHYNQGLDDLMPVPLGTLTYVPEGKLNKSAVFGSAYFNFMYTHATTNELSIAFWVNPQTPAAWSDIFSLGGVANRLEKDNGTSSYRWYANAAPYLLASGTLLFNLPSGQWSHVIMTANGSKVTFYVNGTQTGTYTQTASIQEIFATNTFLIAVRTTAASNKYAGYMNDFRIYDHCLSKKEASELAKGLILHMPLNNNGYGGRNFITTMSGGGRTALLDKYTLEADFSQNMDSYGYFNVSPALELDTPYTLSFDVSNFPEGGKWGWRLWNNANYEVMVTGNGHYTYTFTPIASKLPTNYSLTKFLFDDGGRTNPANKVIFSNFKIEAGTKETPWAPNQSNFFETDFQIDETSGYNRSGTAVQLMNISSDTPRYDVSTVWKDSTDFIHIPNFIEQDSTISEITICGWFKTNTLNSTAPNLFNFGANNFIRGRIAGSTALWSYWNINGTKVGVSATTGTTTDDKWHHYAFSFKDGVIKTYFDGMLKGTSDQSETGTVLLCQQIINWGLGGYTPTGEKFIGQQSDFRVYNTALLDEEILELYEGRPGIDNKGNGYFYAIEENTINPIGVKSKGVAMAPNAFYEGEASNISYNSDLYDYRNVSYSKTPTANGTNQTISGFKVWYGGSHMHNKKARVRITVDWNGFDASSTAGTFNLRFQGAAILQDGSISWTNPTGASNAICTALNNQQNLKDLVLSADSGTYTYDTEFTIKCGTGDTYAAGHCVGWRADYSNGVGQLTVSNIQVMPLDTFSSEEQSFKITEKNMVANYIYEI